MENPVPQRESRVVLSILGIVFLCICLAAVGIGYLFATQSQEILSSLENNIYTLRFNSGYKRQVNMKQKESVIITDPEIQGGVPVFTGTRVPLKNLIDYLEAGDTLDTFLDAFPSVTRAQAIAALELAQEMLTTYARTCR